MIAIVRICCRNYVHDTSHRSCLPIYWVAIVRLLLFVFLDDFERKKSSCHYQIQFYSTCSCTTKSDDIMCRYLSRLNTTAARRVVSQNDLQHRGFVSCKAPNRTCIF